MVAFKRAIEQIGLKHVQRFLEVLEDFSSYSFSKDLKTEILDFMKANYSESEETWHVLCTMCTSEEDNFKRFKITDNEYKGALNRFSNERMWSLYLEHLVGNLKLNFNTNEQKFYLNKLDEELSNCFKVNLISKSTFIRIVNQLSDLKCTPAYLQTILKCGLDKWNNDLTVWYFYVKSQIESNRTKVEIKNLFNKLLKLVSSSQLDDESSRSKFVDLIRVYVDWATNNLTERELIKMLETNCTVNVSIRDLTLSRNIASYFKPILLEQVSPFTDGQLKRRQMFEKYKLMNPIVKEFYLTMIELEIDDSDDGCIKDSDVKYIRKVYNEMLAQFGKDEHKLWLDFCEFELRFGSYVEISRIYEIAKKQLSSKESDLFVQNYSLLSKKLGY